MWNYRTGALDPQPPSTQDASDAIDTAAQVVKAWGATIPLHDTLARRLFEKVVRDLEADAAILALHQKLHP